MKSVIDRFFVLAVAIAGLLGITPSFANTPSQSAFDATAMKANAQAGDYNAAYQLGTLDYVGIGVVQDYVGAMTWLKKAADAGNAEAQWQVGFLYQTGCFGQGPPPPDLADAVPWYQKSAAQGNAYGEFGLAALLLTGQGVPKDAIKAAALFAQAAAQGLVADPSSFPLQQMQHRFYAIAYKISGQTRWVDLVSRAAGGGQ
jgi:TPR repeat protein